MDEFLEKPADPPPMPGNPEMCYASMGNYVFDTNVLVDALRKDADDDSSRHDIGGNIIPMLVRDGCAQAYDFALNKVPGASPQDVGYWRDVGSLDAYFDAHMDLGAVTPAFNLYNDRWPILTNIPSLPPAKFVHDAGDRVGRAIDSLVSNGVIVSGGLVRQSVLSPGVRVNSWATVERSVLLHNTKIGRHAVVRNAIIDKNVIGARMGAGRRGQGARQGTRLRRLGGRHHRGGQGPGGRAVTDKLNPVVMSKTVRISPLLVLIAVLVGASLGSLVDGLFGGFVAALLAIPLAGALQVLVKEIWQATRPRRHPSRKIR